MQDDQNNAEDMLWENCEHEEWTKKLPELFEGFSFPAVPDVVQQLDAVISNILCGDIVCEVCSQLYLPMEEKRSFSTFLENRFNTENQCCENCQQNENYAKLFEGVCDEIPLELQGLTTLEEVLLARNRLMAYIFRLRSYLSGNGMKMRGNCVAYPSTMQTAATVVVSNARAMPQIFGRPEEKIKVIVGARSEVTGVKALYVRRARVQTALQWLKENNPLYADIEIDVSHLPENDVYLDAVTVIEAPDDPDETDDRRDLNAVEPIAAGAVSEPAPSVSTHSAAASTRARAGPGGQWK